MEPDFDFLGFRSEEMDESKSVWEWVSIDIGVTEGARYSVRNVRKG